MTEICPCPCSCRVVRNGQGCPRQFCDAESQTRHKAGLEVHVLTQCPGTLPLLMNTLSSFCSELIFLWVLCTFQFFCCSCASSSVDFYSQDLCFCYFLLLSESSLVFFQSSSIPVHLFITVCFTWWILSLAAGDEKHLCSMKHASAHQCRVGKHLVQPEPCDQPLSCLCEGRDATLGILSSDSMLEHRGLGKNSSSIIYSCSPVPRSPCQKEIPYHGQTP